MARLVATVEGDCCKRCAGYHATTTTHARKLERERVEFAVEGRNGRDCRAVEKMPARRRRVFTRTGPGSIDASAEGKRHLSEDVRCPFVIQRRETWQGRRRGMGAMLHAVKKATQLLGPCLNFGCP